MSVLTGDITQQLEATVDAAVASPSAFSDAEALVGLDRQIERLKALQAHATAAVDASGGWMSSGARTMAAWLAGREHLPQPGAHRRVKLARALRSMPAVEAAWLAGDIGEAQVGVLARARYAETEAFFARDEALLVEKATVLRFSHLVRVARYWLGQADPDGEERRAAEAHADRRVALSRSWRGLWFLDGLLDAISGAIVSRVLKQIEDELFAQDWAEAKARLGEAAVCTSALRRSHAQRRADALVVMAQRAAAAPEGARLPEPLFSVLLGEESLSRVCELANNTVVSPGSLVPWLLSAWVERVVFDSPSRVIDVGVRRRIFQGATRLAIQRRDRECFHDFCELPAEDCEVDHVEPYAAGGLTVEANGRVACGAHNRGRHRRP